LNHVRILYFADVRFPLERANGIQTIETCHALATRGHAVDLVVRPDTRTPPRDPLAYYGLPAIERLRIERAPVRGTATSKRIGYLAFAVGRAAGTQRADAVMTRDLGLASLLLSIPRNVRPPVVYESHGYAPDVAAALPELVATANRPTARKLRRLGSREERVWRQADAYVTITVGLAQDMTARFGRRPRLRVVADGVRLGSERAWRDAPPDALIHPIVAYAGHLYPWKGVEILLDALARVPAARGLIVGGHEEEPDLARIRTHAERLGLLSRVTFTGYVDPPRVANLIAGATILVLPNPTSAISSRFTSPLKLFEYMAAGRPIVASDLPSIREVLHHGVDALLVEPGNADALASAIRRLTEDRGLAARIGRAAWDAVPEYSWERRAERLEAVLLEAATAQR
jgi:glycosyltransferase involved in cell wall biosynthesis